MTKHIVNVASAAGLLACAFFTPVAHADVPLESVVAIVEDDVILASELAMGTQQFVQQMRAQRVPIPAADLLKKQVLDRLIMTKLQMQKAARTGIKVDKNTVNQALTNIAQRNNLSLQGFVQALKSQRIDYSAYRQTIKEQITVQRLKARDVDRRILITEKDIDDALGTAGARAGEDDEFKARHILIAFPKGADAEKRSEIETKANTVLQKLVAGEDFGQTAVAFSNGQRALYGGELGWRKGSKLPSIFLNQLVSMQQGETSNLIRSPAGFHILKLEDRRTGQRQMVKEHKTRHILIRVTEARPDAVAKAKLSGILKRLRAGEDFGQLAEKNSEDPGSAARRGELGWAGPGKFVPPFEAAVTSLKAGETSDLVRTKFGWHVIQVLDTREVDGTMSNRRQRVMQSIRERRSAEETELWLRRLRDEAYVKIKD